LFVVVAEEVFVADVGAGTGGGVAGCVSDAGGVAVGEARGGGGGVFGACG
jgi:hypothetical protein